MVFEPANCVHCSNCRSDRILHCDHDSVLRRAEQLCRCEQGNRVWLACHRHPDILYLFRI